MKMGNCACCSKPREHAAGCKAADVEIKKEYSWAKSPAGNKQDFMVEAAANETVVKRSLNGSQFVIQDCRESRIFLLDNVSSVNVDLCHNCAIVIGPCSGSVFIRECSDCVIMVICQQLRLRDCRDITIYASSATNPAIESCVNIIFSCLQLNFQNLQSAMSKANISPFNNNFANVYDFTPDVPANFRLIDVESGGLLLRSHFNNSSILGSLLDISRENSLFPELQPETPSDHSNPSLITIFHDDPSCNFPKTRTIISNCSKSSHSLQRSKHLFLSKPDIIRIWDKSLSTRPLIKSVLKSNEEIDCICLQVSNKEEDRSVEQAVESVDQNLRGVVVVMHGDDAARHIKVLWNFADMRMN